MKTTTRWEVEPNFMFDPALFGFCARGHNLQSSACPNNRLGDHRTAKAKWQAFSRSGLKPSRRGNYLGAPASRWRVAGAKPAETCRRDAGAPRMARHFQSHRPSPGCLQRVTKRLPLTWWDRRADEEQAILVGVDDFATAPLSSHKTELCELPANRTSGGRLGFHRLCQAP